MQGVWIVGWLLACTGPAPVVPEALPPVFSEDGTPVPSRAPTTLPPSRPSDAALAVVPEALLKLGRTLPTGPALAPQALAASYDDDPRPHWITVDLKLAYAGLDALRMAREHGYRPAAYHADAVAERLLPGDDGYDPVRLAEADLLLTDGIAALAAHLWAGRVHPNDVDVDWHAQREDFDADAILEASRKDPVGALLGVLPKAPGYARLVGELARLRAVAEAGGWPVVEGSEVLEGAAPADRVRQVIARLKAEGDLGLDAQAEAFDDTVLEALERFQRRHGLEATRRVDALTLAALQRPVEAHIDDVRVNLERWRWLPDTLGQRYVRVNIPAFTLEAREDDAIVMTMEVVVGRPYRQTPVFSSTMRRVVYNPSWTVPPGIASKDVVPAIQKDAGYLKRKGIQVLKGGKAVDPSTIDWRKTSPSAVTFRQPPGAANALGKVKLLFPNPFSVYLHDTPSKELFAESRRDFSSGCVRLSKPLDLAAWVLRDQPEGSPEAIAAALASKKETFITVANPVQVHLQYATNWVDDEGVLQRRIDVYERDGRLLEALGELPP